MGGLTTDSHPQHPIIFSAIEVVLIIKDFTIAMDRLFASHSIDITDRTAACRRRLEEAFMESSNSDFDESGFGTFERVEDALRNLVTVVNDWVHAEHGISITSDTNVSAWLQNHRSASPDTPRLFSDPIFNAEVGSQTVSSGSETRRVMRPITPSWTGLHVSQAAASVSTTRSSGINVHGGKSSALEQGRQSRRNKSAGLIKASDGKHRTS